MPSPARLACLTGALLAAALAVPRAADAVEFVGAWGGPGAGAGQFSAPRGIAVNSATGDVYVSDTGNQRIQRFAADGAFLGAWGGAGAGDGQLSSPAGVAVNDATGEVYVVDAGNARIQRFTAAGAFLSAWVGGDGGFSGANGIAVQQGTAQVHVADTGGGRIQRFGATGTYLGSSPTGGPGTFGPMDVAVNPSTGDVYVAELGDRIERYDAAGALQGTWGATGAGSGQFNVPRGLAVHAPSGEVFVADGADGGNSRVQRFGAAGTFLEAWGGLGTGPGRFNVPDDVAVNAASGDVYVVEATNARVQRFRREPGAPPPPPAPPAPQVIDVRVTAPPARGGAAVVTAQVAGDTERIEWDVTGDGRPEIVAEPGQTSLRFRPAPGRRTTVSVRAIGPGGASAPRQQVIVAPAVGGDALARRVAQRVAARPPVYAVGAAEVLTRAPAPAPRCTAGATAAQALPRLPATTVVSGSLTYRGALAPATSVAQIPRAVQGVVQRVSTQLTLPRTAAGLGAAAAGSDVFVAAGEVTLNREIALAPRCDAATGRLAPIAVAPQGNAFAASRGFLTVAGARLPVRNQVLTANPARPAFGVGIATSGLLAREANAFRRNLQAANADLDAALRQLGATLVGFPSIGGLADGASVTVNLRLPPWLQRAGVSGEVRVTLLVRGGKLVVDNLRIGPFDVNIGALRVNGFQVSYQRTPAPEWRGQGRACVIGAVCLDMIPNRGHVRIRNGELDFAGATLDFRPIGGIQLFPAVSLNSINFHIGRNPTRFGGGANFGVFRIVEIDGQMFMAFPNAPFRLRPEEIGGLPGHLYARTFTGTTFGVRAAAYLTLPVIGRTRLAYAYLVYEHPSYVAFGGGFDVSLLGVAQINGELRGIIDGNRPETIYLFEGSVHACLKFVGLHCTGATAVISRGTGGTGGAGVCFGSIGGGIQWPNRGNGFKTQVFLYPPGGKACPIIRFTALDFRARAAGGGRQVVDIRPGDPPQAIRLSGTSGAPRVQVTGPGGRVLRGTSPVGFDVSEDGSLGISSIEGEGETAGQNLTVISINDPRPGRYTIEPLAGSPPVTAVARGEHPAAARATGRVQGSGLRRTLRYRVDRRPGQRVTFYEMAGTDAGKAIGTTTGGEGVLRFATAPGRGTRWIEAQFELDGLPAERLRVARFTPPSPTLARPKQVRVRRAGTRVLVSWRAVSGATRYEVAVTRGDGAQRTVTTRGARTSVLRIPRSSSGRVSVRATDTQRTSRAATAPLRRAAAPASGLSSLPRCRGTGVRLSCR